MGFQLNTSVLNQKGSPAIYTDTFANRPAFGYAGRLFISNDTAAIYEDTGTAWVLIANVSSGAGTLQQVTTNGNTSNVGISITAGGLSSNSVTNTSLTNGSILFSGSGGLVSQDNAKLFWDNTNKRIGLNNNNPANTLDISSAETTSIIVLNNTSGNKSTISYANSSVNKWTVGNTSTNNFEIFNHNLLSNALAISTASNSVSFLASIKIQQGAGFAGIAGYNGIGCDSGGFFFQLGTSTNNPYLNFINLTAARTYTFPDATGTIALTTDLANYLPLTGGTLTGTLNGTSANFTGNVGIGTSSPTGLLDVRSAASVNAMARIAGGAGTTLATLNLGNTTGNYGVFEFDNANDNVFIKNLTNDGNLIFQTTTSSGTLTTAITITIAQVVRIANLAGTGSRFVIADASGNLSAPVSDETVKENVQSLQYGLNAIMQLNPISFEYIDEYKNYGEGLQIGNIAQDVAKVIPEAVFTTPSTGLMGINYNQFDGIYIKAIQELNNKIDTLLQRIELLENK